jgi:hypothetical protein
VTNRDTIGPIRAWASERRLPESHLQRWLAMAEADRAALLKVARTLRLSTGATVSTLAMLDEVAHREHQAVESILGRDEIARIMRNAAPVPERARAFLDALRRMRYPRLAEATARLEAEIAALGLPRGISVLLPKDLSSDELKIELRAKAGRELRRLVDALVANSDQLSRIVDLLGGEDES